MPIPSAGADATRIYDELLVTTAENIQPQIVENALNAHPIISMFAGSIGRVMNSPVGADGAQGMTAADQVSGESIRQNVKLGANESFGWLANGYSTIDITAQDNLRGSRANFRLGAGSVVISGSEMRKNTGAAQVANLLTEKQTDAVSAAVDGVGSALGASSAATNGITTLNEVIGANNSLQGLSGADASFVNWNSRGLSAKGTAPSAVSFAGGSFASTGIQNWRTAWINAEEGAIKPKALLTTDLIYTYYEGSLVPDVRFEDTRMGDLGFQALQFKTAPVFHDPFVQSGVTFFLNPDYLRMKHLPGGLFDLSPQQTTNNINAFYAFVIFEGQIVCSARKYQNKVTSQTA